VLSRKGEPFRTSGGRATITLSRTSQRTWLYSYRTMAGVIKEPCDEGVVLSGGHLTPCTSAAGRWILAATILASSMAFIDGTVVNVALPFLQQNLNATVIEVQWVVEAYSLFLSALVLVGGSLGDHYGRRRIFLSGVGLFALASAACGIATNIDQLIIARAIQGIGAALLVPGSLSLISASFAFEERGQAIGTWSGFSAMTTALGPVAGGWLIEHVSWRAVFFINVPVALAVLVISFRHVPESHDRNNVGPLDWPGGMLATIGLAGIVYGLVESPRLGFSSLMVIAPLVIGAASLTIFLFHEARSQNPMLPLALFRSTTFAGANLLTLLLYAALGGALFFLPLNLIQVQGYSATAAGAAFLPFVTLMSLLSRWSGGLVHRFGARLPLTVGPVITATGYILLMLPGRGGHYWNTFLPAVVVLGLGMAISVAPLTTTVMTSVNEERAGTASGINNAVARVAGLLAIAVLGIVMLHTFSRHFDEHLLTIGIHADTRQSLTQQRVRLAAIEVPSNVPAAARDQIQQSVTESFLLGFRLVMLVAAVLALASGASAWLMIGRGKG
jgi:EmrB/QacA subfamily drug resistance transporter